MVRPNLNRLINKAITISCITTDLEKQMVLRASSGIWVLGFGLELLLIHKLMTTSGSIFLAGASRGVGHQIARILATQHLPVLALIRSPAAQSNLQALNVETVVGDAPIRFG